MKLKEDGKVSYSPKERQLFSLLKQKPQSSVDLRKKLYGDSDYEPVNSRQLIVGTLKNLELKVKINKEPFHIRKTERSGPIPQSFWIEPKRQVA